MSRNGDEKMREEFWKGMAEETGEEILNHALLRVMASEPDGDLKDKWLLFFSTENCLYYKRFPSDSMMARLFNTGEKEKEYPLEGLRWENIRCIGNKKRSLIARLLGSPASLELRWGDGPRLFIEMDRAGEALFKGRLEEA